MSSDTVVDLRELIEADLGPPPGRRGCRGDRPWWLCPFHDDQNPSLSLTPDGGWLCFACSNGGDAIDWVRQRNPGTSFRDAKDRLGLSSLPTQRRITKNSTSRLRKETSPNTQKRSKQKKRKEQAVDPDRWQASGREIIKSCQATLWSPNGDRARAWLTSRGLCEGTLRRYRLGLNPDGREIAEHYVARGITIPWIDGERVLRIKIRCASEDPKYISVAGALGGGLYPSSALAPGKPCLVLEGEFDTLLAIQELEELANAVTFGSAGEKPFPIQLRPLFAAPLVLVATDADPAGDEIASDIISMLGRARRLRPVGGKDLTEMWKSGIDLREWVSNALHEAGWKLNISEMTDEARELYEERVAILEFDAGLSRQEAEAGARANVPRMIQRMEELEARCDRPGGGPDRPPSSPRDGDRPSVKSNGDAASEAPDETESSKKGPRDHGLGADPAEARASFCDHPRTMERPPEDLRVEYEERAAIMEYDGGLSRPEAEEAALRQLQENQRILGAETS